MVMRIDERRSGGDPGSKKVDDVRLKSVPGHGDED